MTIADLLRDKIEAFTSAHRQPPAFIKLGRSQMRELDALVSRYISTEAPPLGYPNFDGIKVDATDDDSLIELLLDD